MVLFCENLGGHDVALVAHTTGAFVGLSLVLGRAHDDDEIVLADFAIHEMRQMVSRNGMPVVQVDVHAIMPQSSGQLSDPILMGLVVPGVGDEGCRMGRHTVGSASV